MSDGEEEELRISDESEEEVVADDVIEEEEILESEEDQPDEILVDDTSQEQSDPTGDTHYVFTVRVCLPIDMMPGIEARLYIDTLIKRAGGKVDSVVRCARLPSADYETQMKEHTINVQIPVPSGSARQSALASFLSRFTTQSRGGLHNQVMIEIPKLTSVFNEIRTDDSDVLVNNLALGNCPNPGLFFVRGNFFSRNNNMLSNLSMPPDRPGGSTRNVFHQCISWAHFEHDQKQITIRFAVKLTTPSDDGLLFRGFRIVLQYTSIQSITVDAGAPIDSNRSIDFFFRLKHPPALYEVQPTHIGEKRVLNLGRPEKRYNNWSRVLEWPGDDRSQGCSRLCLSESSVFHLSIKDNKGRNKMFSIAARIQSRVSTIKVFFGSIVSMRRKAIKLPVLPSLGSFRADYALQAIVSRGMAVTDELFDARTGKDQGRMSFFMKRLLWCMKECRLACEEALELVLTAIDERRNITVERAFDRLYSTRVELYRRSASSQRSVQAVRTVPPNCVLIRKLMVTPSRQLPMAPDVMMTNRVVRQFGADHALRIVYRDENFLKLRTADFGTDQMAPLLIDMVKNTMDGRVTICGRDYQFLAWSNSQMRDQGCYMYSQVEKEDGSVISIDNIRDWMGNFSSSKNVPKLMARMGQCF
ncbi:hypothetical protein PFISCL1PPCAC_23707, partial [Pristionchus fissidentatus]